MYLPLTSPPSPHQKITDMTPVSERPFHERPKSRKEKNKLASR